MYDLLPTAYYLLHNNLLINRLLMVTGSWLMAHGSWLESDGSCFKARGSGPMADGEEKVWRGVPQAMGPRGKPFLGHEP